MTDIDEDTGLPALPPKYRWRVTDYSITLLGMWGVKLQYMLFGFIPFTVEDSWTTARPTAEAVRDHAEMAYRRWKRARRVRKPNPFRGNYPPKRLDES